MSFSAAYIAHLSAGAFPQGVDPWAEDDPYFSQLHSGIIGALLAQLWQPLLAQGYHISKEASLQISTARKPDMAIHQRLPVLSAQMLDYPAAAVAIQAEPGERVALDEPEFQALAIKASDKNALVTIVEIILPRNKTHWADMTHYREARDELFLQKGVNVVEIDLTRSVKRLFDHALTRQCDYHVAILLPTEAPYIVKMVYGEPLKRCALPLRQNVIGIDLQLAYAQAYREATLAAQMLEDKHYTLENLPFPALLSFAHQQAVMTAVNEWYIQLQALRSE
jgi:hypothetical protein